MNEVMFAIKKTDIKLSARLNRTCICPPGLSTDFRCDEATGTSPAECEDKSIHSSQPDQIPVSLAVIQIPGNQMTKWSEPLHLQGCAAHHGLNRDLLRFCTVPLALVLKNI